MESSWARRKKDEMGATLEKAGGEKVPLVRRRGLMNFLLCFSQDKNFVFWPSWGRLNDRGNKARLFQKTEKPR